MNFIKLISHYIQYQILIRTTVWGNREDKLFIISKGQTEILHLTTINGYNLAKVLNILPLITFYL